MAYNSYYNYPIKNMDVTIKEEDFSLAQVAFYASASFFLVSLFGLVFYITCSRRFKLNWFEKNLLEAASETEELGQSREALVNMPPLTYNADSISESSRSLNRGNITPTSINDDPTFWVPSKQGHGTYAVSSADESPPLTPTSPSGSNRSVTLSTGSGTLPIARSDKHILLAMNPSRPKVSSMTAKLDHTKIDTSLYQSTGSEQTEEEHTDLRGTIHLSILYDPIAGILTIRLIEAQHLQPRDFSGTADPYAKIRLLPDKKNVWQTRIHKRTLNPIFDEDFVFEERPAVIGRRTLEILLYDFDAYSRHVCIGGTQISLAHVDLSDKVELWKPLGNCSEQDAKIDLGDVMISLSFLPSAERLTVVVIKARNLLVIDDTRNSSDPYVKVAVIHGGKKIKKRKTGVQRNTVCPTFNEALTFDIARDTLKNAIIEFVVLHDSLLGSDEVLGRAIIGNTPQVRQEDRTFFEEVFRSKTATAQWIPLAEGRIP